ncbi:hypothetical protein B9P52_20055 [Achromobacter denitrificans]|uniref:DUF421 domain-containing protein n=1 Tax=Achromobacter denitrificans TaxID=32002 RepID=UPI000B4CF376|nr:YetF domain-containing protein [Achromobacter denitrificans]ASC66422.1 hypothetical protein B9P52_20055 [Achromobacter denitrificans]QCS64690.1 DUF421 domain-containing protein [Achromobacter denitrificans]
MSPDWSAMFTFSVSPLEIIVRGSIVYWFIFVLLRVAGRRDVGSFGVADMLVLVLIADAAQNAMAGEYTSIVDGLILVGTIVGWTVLVDRIGYFFQPVGRFLSPDRVCLVHDGVIARRNLRREYITEEELMSELRLKGIADIREVHRAYMESDGDISVLKRPKTKNPGR